MRKTAIAFALAAAACTSQPTMPETQRAYVETWRTLKSEWEATDGNRINRDAVEVRAKEFFNERPRIDRWTAKLESVESALGKDWVVATIDGIEFRLFAPSKTGAAEAFRAALPKFSPGDRIVFDGSIDYESSFTIAGAIRKPELRVILDRIELHR
jgi:hypothetical protein